MSTKLITPTTGTAAARVWTVSGSRACQNYLISFHNYSTVAAKFSNRCRAYPTWRLSLQGMIAVCGRQRVATAKMPQQKCHKKISPFKYRQSSAINHLRTSTFTTWQTAPFWATLSTGSCVRARGSGRPVSSKKNSAGVQT